MEPPDSPEAPVHLNNAEASAWQSGWQAGFKKGFEEGYDNGFEEGKDYEWRLNN